MTVITPITKCVACGGKLFPVHDFGETPLANTYGIDSKFPLVLNGCEECFHLQLADRVAPEILYSDYVYCSGTSQSAFKFFSDFAVFTAKYVPDAKSVLDIACNDGTQLDAFKLFGLETHGCDPAEGLAPVATENGHKVFVGMFEDMPAKCTFDIITAENVIAHTSRPLEFMQNAKRMMHSDSRMFVLTSQAEMVSRGQFDTIYHEHISYFNALSMLRLVERSGLRLLDIQLNPFHGTSYVFIIGREGKEDNSVVDRIVIEDYEGLQKKETFIDWSSEIDRKLSQFRNRLRQFRNEGFRTIGLCAAAKGISMLNMAREKLEMLFDNTPLKQGRIASGMLIRPFSEISDLGPDPVLFINLAWNFDEEVRKNCRAYRENRNDVFATTTSL